MEERVNTVAGPALTAGLVRLPQRWSGESGRFCCAVFVIVWSVAQSGDEQFPYHIVTQTPTVPPTEKR